jgi:hypothetical protein
MEAVSTFETLVDFFEATWRNIPENGFLHGRLRESVKSQLMQISTAMNLLDLISKSPVVTKFVFISI